MTISRRLRFEILRRDDHTCRYCGRSAPEVKLTIDHVTPVALGGKDEPTNLVTACAPCNGGKSSIAPGSELVDGVAEDAMRWARARHEAIAAWRTQRTALAADLKAFAGAWDTWKVGEELVPRDETWEAAVERWLDAGFAIDDLIELIPKAMVRSQRPNGSVLAVEDRWRYFCGVVWRTLDDIEAATRAGVESATGGDAEREQPTDEEIRAWNEKDDCPRIELVAYLAGWQEGERFERSRAARHAALPAGSELCAECHEKAAIPSIGLCTDCWGD